MLSVQGQAGRPTWRAALASRLRGVEDGGTEGITLKKQKNTVVHDFSSSRYGGSRRWSHRNVSEGGPVPRGGTAAARADCCGGRAAACTDRCLTTLRFAVSPDPVIAG